LTDKIFISTDSIPKMDKTIDSLEAIINSAITINKLNIKNKKIFVTFTINCKGEDFDYEVRNYKNKEFNKTLIGILKDNVN
jgi:hypothetical protein